MPPIKDVGRPLPRKTHGPHHHEKTAPRHRAGPGRLRFRNGSVVRRMLFWPVLQALWLLRLRRQVLRSSVQRFQPGVLRHGLLRWLLPVRSRLRFRRLRRLRPRSLRGRHVPGRRLRHALQRRSRLPGWRLLRRRLPGFPASERSDSGRPDCSRRAGAAASNPVVSPSPLPSGPTSQTVNDRGIQNTSYRPVNYTTPRPVAPVPMQPRMMAAPSYWGN